jgi:acyl carrier protein
MPKSSEQKPYYYKDLCRFFRQRHEGEIKPDDNLFWIGALDSLTVTELIVYIEETFGIFIEPEDVSMHSMESFATISGLSELIRKKKNVRAQPD